MIKSAEEWKIRLFNRVLQSYTCTLNGSFFRSFGVWDLTTKLVEEENKRQKKKKKKKKRRNPPYVYGGPRTKNPQDLKKLFFYNKNG